MTGRVDRRRTILRWLPALAWMAVIFALSSQSGLRVTEDAAVDRPLRVVAHLGSYALLAGLLLYAIEGGRRATLRGIAIAFTIAVLYGAGDEVHQSLVPDRTGRTEDLFVDAVGSAIGVAVAAVVLGWSRRRPGEPGSDD